MGEHSEMESTSSPSRVSSTTQFSSVVDMRKYGLWFSRSDNFSQKSRLLM